MSFGPRDSTADGATNVQLVAELGELAGQTPRNVHLVVSSRSDPPIALGRYRLVAEIHGFVGVFVRAGPMILKRLHDIAGPQAAFRDVILARARQSSAPAPARDLRDPLTDREMEILSYLPTRFTSNLLSVASSR